VYILDLNVLNVIDGSRNNRNVQHWLQSVDSNKLFISSITFGEVGNNLARLSRSKAARADVIRVEQALGIYRSTFSVVKFCEIAAEDWGRMIAEKGGRFNELCDAAIAAVARRHRYFVVTNNTTDFQSRGASTLNPFKDPAEQVTIS
jgi:toxin FitB